MKGGIILMSNYYKEEWKVIEEFPRYSVSNYGRILSRVRKEECIL